MTPHASLQAIQLGYQTAIQALAGQYRAEVLVPFCKKYKLDFVSGNGTWFFIDLTQPCDSARSGFQDIEDAPRRVREVLRPVWNVLDFEVSRDDYLGYYVEEVRDGSM